LAQLERLGWLLARIGSTLISLLLMSDLNMAKHLILTAIFLTGGVILSLTVA